MSHQVRDCQIVRGNAASLKEALRWLLCHVNWSGIRFRDDCSWMPRQLAATAILWAWSDEKTLHQRFLAARRIAAYANQPQREFAGSSQAFLKMLVRWTETILAAVRTALRRRMTEALAACREVHGFIVFGVDGSRVELPRTLAHEAVNSPARNSRGRKFARNRRKKPRTAAHTKKADTPQIWLTLLWHVGTGLPWSWRSGPTGSSEREHWRQMFDELPPCALIAADAGFVGYDYLRAVTEGGRNILIRVGSNVRLLKKLGWAREHARTVYVWPDRVAARHQAPLLLRLVIAAGGKHPMYLLTNVSSNRLTDARVIELYRRRWGIELYFRHFKQTFERRKLRSACPENARVELDWSLIGLWSLGLYAQVELNRREIDPLKLSMAGALLAFRSTMRDYRHPVERGRTLRSMLRSPRRWGSRTAPRDRARLPDRSRRPDSPAVLLPDPERRLEWNPNDSQDPRKLLKSTYLLLPKC